MSNVNLSSLTQAAANFLFSHRLIFLWVFIVVSLGLGVSAFNLKIDAGFNKMIPLQHEYMKTFTRYEKTFGGANRILVVLMQKEGEIFNPGFFGALKKVTDDVFFIPGVDRATVSSLFTPNVRFIEVIEEGFTGGNVIPANFQGLPEEFLVVQRNVRKSGMVGRLVANNFKGALVRAELLEIDPNTGAKLGYGEVSKKLEEIRSRYSGPNLDVHIIGFAKAVSDIRDGASGVIKYFLVAFIITALLLAFYLRSLRLTALALITALAPVLWMLGLLPILGYGLDPLSILAPFLIFSIGVSHAVQMTNVWSQERLQGENALSAAKAAFIKLFVPGSIALIANALGFIVILHIKIAVVQELAITASLGVLLMIITNKMLLPIILSYSSRPPKPAVNNRLERLWGSLTGLATRTRAPWVLLFAFIVLLWGVWRAADLKTGDLGQGIPELHADSRYNRDNAVITKNFSIGVDVLSVIARTVEGACTDYAVMDTLDRFEARMSSIEGVQSVLSLAGQAKIVYAGWNEGNLKWRVLARDPAVLAQSVSPIDTSTGLLNSDCSAMQVLIFTRDHQGDTIARIVKEVKSFSARHNSEKLKFLLASGNVGVMAATNEAVDRAEIQMLISLFASIALLCLLTFRSWRAVLCITIPLALVSILCNALMAELEIGLKVSGLAVIALGVGVGVDYGIYLFERLRHGMLIGQSLVEAYYRALLQRGSAAAFTAITMSMGVGTWAFSDLKFQSDMGVLLAFMFLINMVAALVLLPALAAFLLKPGRVNEHEQAGT